MASVRLARRRRREQTDPRSAIILHNETSFIQFEQVVPIDGKRHPDENKDHHSNLTNRRHFPPKLSKPKKKTRTVSLSERFTSESLSSRGAQRLPGSHGTVPFIPQLRISTESSGTTVDPNHLPVSSEVLSHISLSSKNQQKTESPYPQSVLIGPSISEKQCTCHIIIRYRSDPISPSTSYNSRRDEVTVFQVANNGAKWIVFKGFLKADDSFNFKSQRSVDDRFHLKLEINGSLDTTVSACCEHLFRHGGRIDDGDSSFWIETVEQYTLCAKCRDRTDSSKASDDEKTDVASSLSSEESDEKKDHCVAAEKSTKTIPEKPVSTVDVQSLLSQPSPSYQPQIPIVAPLQSTSNVEKTSTQTGPPVVVASNQTKTADNELTLSKYINDVMQQALSEPKPSQTIPPRRMGNVENFTIVCIDQDEKRYLSFLHPIVNLIRTMSDPSTLGTLLAACTYEKLIVIVSLDQGELVLAELKKHKCVQAIYFLSKQTQLPAWANDHDNITVGIHQNIELIHDHLIETLPHVSARMIPLEITPKDSNSDRPFIYCQLLKETILCEDDRINSRKDMLAFCRLHCAHNPKEIHDIEEFENSFTDTHSIGWYTRRCFLSKILSRAFRTQEIDLLFKMRYYIQCLHQQIQSIAAKESTTVYVILDVDQDTILKLQASVNGLVVFHSFLPATLDPPTLLDHQNKDTSRGIVFSIRLGPECAANIEQLRSSNCKIDVLIDIKTVFRVISIVEGETGVYAVNLESVPHDDAHFLELTDALRAETKATVIILQLTKLLLATGHYWEVDYLTELIYQDKSFEDDGQLLASLASAHHLLGNVDETKRAFKAARHQFFRSLRAFRLFLPDNHAMLSSTYNNIGSMFYHDDLHERAVKFHEMALQCQFKASSPNMKAVATYSANIGAVYIDQKKYAEAVSHLKRAALILEKTSVEDNAKGLISIFQKISNCFWSIKQPKAALEYYKKTLDIQLKLPNPLPHPLSVTYYNLSTAYSSIGDFDEAVTCAEKSIEYLKMVSNSDEELKDNQAHLEIIRQKQWLKQVLSA